MILRKEPDIWTPESGVTRTWTPDMFPHIYHIFMDKAPMNVYNNTEPRSRCYLGRRRTATSDGEGVITLYCSAYGRP